MKVCDKCRKTIEKGTKVLDAELCGVCVKQIKEWIKKPVQASVLGSLGNLMGGNK